MKKTLYTVLLVLLTASCDDDITPRYTVGEENNAIVLGAGIMDGGSGAGVQTRATGDVVYHKFEGATQLRLRVEGTWLGKDNYTLPHGKVVSTLAKQITKASTATDPTIDSDNDTNRIPDTHIVSFAAGDQLSWDDYGSADPANMSSAKGGTVTDGSDGRSKGLTIYGVAVNGQSTLPDALSETVSWTELAWAVGTPASGTIDQTGGWLTKDLLTSNNVTATENNTYKFDDRSQGKLLKFKHAMTKVTVNLIADEGFPGYTTDHPENAKFKDAPAVTLLNFNYQGKVSVEDWTSTPESGIAVFKTWRDDGADWTSGGQHTSQFTALVFPGNKFDDATDIIQLVVDGNTLNVNASKINAANTADDNVFEHGKNYIFNIIVKKTGIVVTATIKNWENVEATEEAPKINIDKVYGHPDSDDNCTNFAKGFDLYRSTTITGSYISGDAVANHTVVSFDATAGYTMSPQLYWPNHNTHYFFRGVWPLVGSKDDSNAQIGPTQAQVKDNAVEVQNVAYKQGYYPSDLMIGRPLKSGDETPDETCKVDAHKDSEGHSPAGICATEGNVHINFRYVMSQVKVELKSESSDESAIVTFDADTKVKIIGGYTQGAIKLSDCTADFTGETVTDYVFHKAAADDYDSYHDAIIPQSTTNLKFRISIKTGVDAGGNALYDVYECAIKDIKVTEGTADPALITAWERGKIYTYTLNITKTALTVTATLKDWVTVTASTDVWF